MLTFSNLLSISRIPLALLFLKADIFYRIFAIILAMLTDCLDGFLARRFRATSQFGAILDPLVDKFFVIFALVIFFQENRLSFPEAISLICRDFSILLFGVYLGLKGFWTHFQFRSIWSGKITTALQFLVLIGLTFHVKIPSYVYISFIVLGLLALIELYLINKEVTLQ
jgi:CDP-diacylglycerol--glycerol-3-phosphate 3-phosphatidyltransferase